MYKNPTKTLILGNSLVYLPSCHSTNKEAQQLIQKSSTPEGTLVITNEQTKGRGQRGNRWEASAGKNYTFSLIMKPNFLALRDSFYLNIWVSLGIIYYLNQIQDGFEIKWPNDIYFQNKKIGGILIENSVKGHSLQFSIIGIGLNMNQIHFENFKATSLKLITGQEFALDQELEPLLLSLEKQYFELKRGKVQQLLQKYLENLMWKDEQHRFKAEEEFSGTIRGISSEGKLLIEREGTTKAFDFKEVSFLI